MIGRLIRFFMDNKGVKQMGSNKIAITNVFAQRVMAMAI